MQGMQYLYKKKDMEKPSGKLCNKEPEGWGITLNKK
jgi:hypothetical protein